MAVTKAQAETKAPATGETVAVPAPADAPLAQTRLDSDVSKPSTVAPGEAPYDTTDATEIATSVSPDKASAAEAGFGTVNAVMKLERVPGQLTPDEVANFNGGDSGGEARTETYQQVGPNGQLVTVTHNIDTGETSVS